MRQQEIWKAVSGYEGHYAVSNLGQVRSVKHHRPRKVVTDRHISYPYVGLSRYGVVTRHNIHLLVLTAFRGPRPEGCVACHNDGDRLNYRLSNLRWDTPGENEADKILHGTTNRGIHNGNHKLTKQEVWEIRNSIKFQKDIAKEFGISQVWVSMIRTGKYRKHG